MLYNPVMVTPNETEASILTGISVKDDASADQVAGYLLNKGVENVIITLGKQGAFLKNKELSFTIMAPVVQALDTTAAGDTFSGALTVALTEGINWEKSVRFAVEAASISVTRMGLKYQFHLGLNLAIDLREDYIFSLPFNFCH